VFAACTALTSYLEGALVYASYDLIHILHILLLHYLCTEPPTLTTAATKVNNISGIVTASIATTQYRCSHCIKYKVLQVPAVLISAKR
jgi:hypothetical protein